MPTENEQVGPGFSEGKSPRSLPVQLINLPQRPVFGLYTESSLIGQTANGAFYEWRGALRNPSAYETEGLALSLELWDTEGRILSSQDGLVLWEQNQFPLGPEDALPLVIRHRLSLSTSDKIAAARLRLVEAKLRRVGKNWEEGPLRARNFAKTGLQIWERGQLIRPEADFFYHDLALAIAHQGPKPLQALNAEIVWYDQNEQLIHSEMVRLLRNDEPALPPGQKRLFWASFRIDYKREDYQRYEIRAVAPISPPAQ
ncbi:MAG: hypothetical protein HC913_18970 [Microscillaceae bacterium]|nr:hypothetical protein [Microscillaceae bacterium]